MEQEELQLTPLPCWKSLTPEEYRARVQQLIEAIEADARAAAGGDREGSARSRRRLPAESSSRAEPDQEGPSPAGACRGSGGASQPPQGLLRLPRCLPIRREPASRGRDGFRVPRRRVSPAAPGSTRRPNRLAASKAPTQSEDCRRRRRLCRWELALRKRFRARIEKPSSAKALRHASGGRYDLLDRIRVSEKRRKRHCLLEGDAVSLDSTRELSKFSKFGWHLFSTSSASAPTKLRFRHRFRAPFQHLSRLRSPASRLSPASRCARPLGEVRRQPAEKASRNSRQQAFHQPAADRPPRRIAWR